MTNTNGDIWNADGTLKLKPTKAVIGGALGVISMTTTGLTALYSDSVPLVITNIVIGAIVTVLGIYVPKNEPVDAAQRAGVTTNKG